MSNLKLNTAPGFLHFHFNDRSEDSFLNLEETRRPGCSLVPARPGRLETEDCGHEEARIQHSTKYRTCPSQSRWNPEITKCFISTFEPNARNSIVSRAPPGQRGTVCLKYEMQKIILWELISRWWRVAGREVTSLLGGTKTRFDSLCRRYFCVSDTIQHKNQWGTF